MDAAFKYAAAGWYVAPVRPDDRKNPGGRLGKGWPGKTFRDAESIVAWFAGSSDGIALHNGRSGAISFDVDDPTKLPPLLAQAITHLKPPHQSSRANEPGRGHYLFALPPGRMPGNSVPKALGGGWGEIRGRNGVIVVAPSVHADAENGGEYRWLTSGPLPVLPDYLLDLLEDAAEADAAATDAEVAAFLTAHTAEERPELLDVHVLSFHKKVGAGASRHDTMVGHLLGAMRDACAGLLDARSAADTLESVFLEAVAAPGHGKQGEPRTGNRAVAEFRGILSWAVGQAMSTDADDHRAHVAKAVGASSSAGIVADTSRNDEFFNATPVLASIRQAAQSRMLEPWAVLGAVLAHVVAEVPPYVVLPPTVGAVASLNLAVLAVGDSSGGKSSSFSCAGELLPGATAKHVGAPTGEGLVQSFLEWSKEAKANVLSTDPRALMFVDEIGQLEAVMSRQGATLGSTFRSAVSGAKLGNQNADVTRRRDLPAHSYRLTAFCGAQPHLTGVLLRQDEVDAGTPQRWVFLRAKPSSLPVVEPKWPGALPWTPPVFTLPVGHQFVEVGLPDEVRAYVKAQRRAALLGDVQAVDGHLVLTRLKVATALAWLHEEHDVTMLWWDLAGLVVDESCAVRDACFSALSKLRADEDRARGRSDARRAAGAREAVGEECDSNAELLAKTVTNGKHSNARHGPDEGCTLRCLTFALRHRKGADRDCALSRAVDLGWIEERDGRYRAGESWPNAS